MTVTRELSEFVVGLNPGGMKASVRESATRSLVDSLVNMSGGQEFGLDGAGSATTAGLTAIDEFTGDGVGADAYRLAALAQVLDFSDGWRFGGNHPSSPVVAVIAAIAARDRRLSLNTMLSAMVAGYEVAASIAAPTHPAQTVAGFHPTGTIGAVAAAATGSALLGLDVDATAHALSLAATHAPISLIGGIYEGATSKPLDAAHAARTGLESALLARSGVSGWSDAIAAPRGLVGILTQGRGHEVDTSFLGSRYTITEVYLKAFPACRHTHSALEAALVLQSSLAAETHPSEIIRVDVYTYDLAVQVVGRSISPSGTFVAAQLSLPYLVAAALMDGALTADQLSRDALSRSEVHDLAAKVRLHVDPDLNRRYPHANPTTVEITLASGQRQRHHIEIPLGDPRRPLSMDQIIDKAPATPAGIASREFGCLVAKKEAPSAGDGPSVSSITDLLLASS